MVPGGGSGSPRGSFLVILGVILGGFGNLWEPFCRFLRVMENNQTIFELWVPLGGRGPPPVVVQRGGHPGAHPQCIAEQGLWS